MLNYWFISGLDSFSFREFACSASGLCLCALGWISDYDWKQAPRMEEWMAGSVRSKDVVVVFNFSPLYYIIWDFYLGSFYLCYLSIIETTVIVISKVVKKQIQTKHHSLTCLTDSSAKVLAKGSTCFS